MKLNARFDDLVPHFCFEGKLIQVEPCGLGHINDTYAAHFCRQNGEVHRYLMQRINRHVFQDINGLMQNISAVTKHLRKKIATAGGDPDRETLTLVPTIEAKTFHQRPGGDCWRAYTFIEGARTYEAVESLEHIDNVARAFGNFQKLLADFPAAQLHHTIPDFHHTRKRFDALVKAVDWDVANRAHLVQPEIEFAERRAAETSVLVELLDQGRLPQRVTHNDTKINNVMIDDDTGEGVCVIDLDTVMPGSILYDFGDSVRTGAALGAEDERDLRRVGIRLDAFDKLAHGYLSTTRSWLEPIEMDQLAFSAKLMTLECGMRFLTDHLNGDVYFKIHRMNHNLDRCRTQFKMVRDMEESMPQMVRIVNRYR